KEAQVKDNVSMEKTEQKREGKKQKGKKVGRKRKVPREAPTLSHLFPSGKWLDMYDCFAGCPRCPEQWVAYRGSCYSFSKEKKDWNSSQQSCREQGAHLLVISDLVKVIFFSLSVSNYTLCILMWPEQPLFCWCLVLWYAVACVGWTKFQIQRASSSPSLDCVWLQGANIGAAWCGGYKFCICEKVVDPAAVEQVSYLDRH
uniref:C-type lectin domain-containing protein n=1 Tax=Calidris pygmaea TaxID=425635 RepID=A0A8C3J321_9CHAR